MSVQAITCALAVRGVTASEKLVLFAKRLLLVVMAR